MIRSSPLLRGERVALFCIPIFTHTSISHDQNLRFFTTIKNKFGSITATKEEDVVEDVKKKIDLDISKFTKEMKIEMPEILDGQSTAKLVKWYKSEGDIICKDETICDIETDMFTFGMDLDDEGYAIMKEILLKEGEETSEQNTPICIVLHEEEKKEE